MLMFILLVNMIKNQISNYILLPTMFPILLREFEDNKKRNDIILPSL